MQRRPQAIPTLMKLVSYLLSEETRLGALDQSGDLIVDLSRAHRELMGGSRDPIGGRHNSRALPTRMIEFLEGGAEALQAAREALAQVEGQLPGAREEYQRRRILLPLATAPLLAPVPRPPKLIAAWVNYEEHGREATVKAPREAPLFFTKWSTSVIGPGQPIVLPRISRKVDYEAELALVIGAGGKNIPAENACDHIAGYTILNDVSARDFSLRALFGSPGPSDIQKSFDTFSPMGPCLVTRDEIPDPHALGIRLSIGDEVLQDDTTGSMIHRIPAIIAYLSSIATLEPGDVIATGTPSGVGLTPTPPPGPQPGENLRIEIEDN
ncbi:MAG: fumarylacetoacetate hydrolase family protein [Acidobacteriota bacterium]|nr:fumarylacetoacetate hydrolase family protein [Acidobacteriota bacterium]